MSLRSSGLAVLLAACTALGVTAGCALFERRTSIVEQTTKAVEKIEQAAEPTIAVLQCAAFVQRMAFDSGKRLSTSAAIAFCAALESSPDVNPQPAAPVASTIET